MPTGIYKRKGHSLETRLKIKKALVGNKNARGIKRVNSRETRIKMSIAKTEAYKRGEIIGIRIVRLRDPNFLKRERHWNWKGGISNRDIHSLSNPKYVEWRSGVFKRDNWQCRIADGNCRGMLEAHHILRWAEFPELRYQLNNGIALCHFHHPRRKEDEKKLSPYFQKLVAESK